jgi:translation initiation factor 5A
MGNTTEAGKLKEGGFITIDDEPCRIVGISTSLPDKKGKVTVKINALGLFDSQKHFVVKLTSEKVEVPTIERGSARVLAIVANKAQLMDPKTYETFELPLSIDFRGDVREGDEVEYIQALGRRKIELVKG